jgi:acetoacetate decarboxylase
MKIDDVRRTAFAMSLTSPSFPPGPYGFVNREFLIVTYRTDPDALRAVIPEPLRIEAPIAGGRELWGFPKKLASPALGVEKDTLPGLLDCGPVGWPPPP